MVDGAHQTGHSVQFETQQPIANAQWPRRLAPWLLYTIPPCKRRNSICRMPQYLLMLGFSLLIGCQTTADEPEVTDPSSTAVVAHVGESTITVEELRVSFEMAPGFVMRAHRDDPVRAHLQYMIYEKLMAAEGRAQALHERADLAQLLDEIRQDIAVTEMFTADILDTVQVSSAAVEAATQAGTINVQFRYVHTATRAEAEATRAALEAGQVAIEAIATEGKKQDGTNLNFWDLEQQDAPFAAAVRDLDFGVLSNVISTDRGHFLVRVDTAFRDPFLTQRAYDEQRRQYEERLRRLRVDDYAYDYAADRLEAAAPVIRREAFNTLFGFMQQLQQLDTRDPEDALLGNWPGSLDRTGFVEGEPQPLVALSDGQTFTVREFLDWYELRRFPFEGQTEATTANNLTQLIWRMVRDRLLGNEALTRGFDSHPTTVAETQWWEDKLLYWDVRETLLADLELNDDTLRAFHARHAARYTDANGVRLAYEDAREAVAREWYTLAENTRLQRYLNTRMQATDVRIDEAVLARVQRPDPRLPKPVELMVLKKGGTFPRQAYPSIDRVWERY